MQLFWAKHIAQSIYRQKNDHNHNDKKGLPLTIWWSQAQIMAYIKCSTKATGNNKLIIVFCNNRNSITITIINNNNNKNRRGCAETMESAQTDLP